MTGISPAIMTKKSKIFIKAKLTVSKSCLLGFLSFMIFASYGMLISKSQNIFQSECSSCHFFLLFYNPFMILFHILSPVFDHELMLDNLLITGSVWNVGYQSPKNNFDGHSSENGNQGVLAVCHVCRSREMHMLHSTALLADGRERPT